MSWKEIVNKPLIWAAVVPLYKGELFYCHQGAYVTYKVKKYSLTRLVLSRWLLTILPNKALVWQKSQEPLTFNLDNFLLPL